MEVVPWEGEGCIPTPGTIYRGIASPGCNPIPLYTYAMAEKDTKKKQKDGKEGKGSSSGGGKWAVFAIKNNIPRHPQKGYFYFVASQSMTKENILSRLKSIQDSKTGRGGTKELADDIDDAETKAEDGDYSKYFDVQQVASNLNKERAFKTKGDLADATAKVYNKAIIINKHRK